MNIRYFLIALSMGFLFVSCDKIKEQINWDGAGVVSSDDSLDDENDELELLESQSEPRTKNFYTSLLESFCETYFDEHFQGDRYEHGSLVVVKIVQLDDNVVEVSGTHSYKVEMGTKVSGQMFKAKISEKGDGLYDIKFEKGSSKVLSDNSYWDSIEKEYHYE